MMNAAVALDVSLQEMMQHVDSVSFCFSKVGYAAWINIVALLL